ncbi:TIM-barrel domain-containing protein [Actinocatenispora sera]|uniref:TIM-barrel domain-containing protein n=1 Tax=Actinocatenispora sera TaxID=390989 RepID=UPI0033F5CBEF
MRRRLLPTATARRRFAAAGSIVVLTAGLAVAATAPAQARTPRGVVTDGSARFEVLSPTLVRLEYAADGRFTDRPTFNAVGRDAFRPPHYRSTVRDGWRIIRTDRLTLSYREGSGRFTPANTKVLVRVGGHRVTGAPRWPQPPGPCTYGVLCEAEAANLTGGAGPASDHGGYTGTGFVAGLGAVGAGIAQQVVSVPAAGDYQLAVRYANAKGGDGKTQTRTMRLSAGDTTGTLTLPVTGSWDTWRLATATVHLPAGESALSLTVPDIDDGHVNIDSYALTAAGGAYPQPQAPDCDYDTLCEAEVRLLHAVPAAGDHVGFSGTGFVAGYDAVGASSTVRVTGVPAAGDYRLELRYANGKGEPRSLTVSAGDATRTLALPPTASWNNWSTAQTTVHLAKGDSTVALSCVDGESCGVNVDNLAVLPAGAPYPQVLGGYRRSLDGQGGAAPMNDGLLSGAGWSLLDDSHTALFDPAKHTVAQRPGHDGDYQDGYLFGYGSDYPAALADLNTLTGPSALLPRFAYGVWYSRYWAYSQADYENTLVPRFRAENVPLDVLVTDTDWKSPDAWNGWEFDPAYFPDPKGYLDWAKRQGIHATLNVHPSVQQADPKFAAAQATAQGRLTPSESCGSDTVHNGQCYVFDWSDPHQLEAYFDLHDSLQQLGVDFWWLDYCCENSQASMPGITPDAWINGNYAWQREKLGLRGFVLSRIGSSLTAGGYSGSSALPSGPWADHRYAVHFTADTDSTWDELANEVAFTPAEGAGIGESNVSHDIGGFHGKHLADDLYARWVQFGAFQPVLRLHSSHGARLPWDYAGAAKDSAERFLRLRESLVPYTYSLARQANATGLPITRAPYLAYPDQPDAYQFASTEYLYGPDVLVAPVTTPGEQADTTVWFPPGTWTDWFTGEQVTGPATRTVHTDLSTMPVFVRSGGIVTTRTGDVPGDTGHPLTAATATIATGGDGRVSLYEDAGDGNGYQHGQSATTALSYTERGGASRLTIGARHGGYPGAVDTRTWTVRLLHADRPTRVTVDGRALAASDTGPGWSYAGGTLTVRLPAGTTSARHRVDVR